MSTKIFDDSILVRVNKKLKADASEVLNSIGLNFSDLVRLTLIKLVHERKLPFEVEFFKDETIEAIRMVEKEEVTRHESVGAYFENRGT
ncbi:type II toxin-antitoxin system RelB/DinJ family antitoxin [uncultured Turicimonas sp.]|uniref:type II toxin-antitoxin system RelB/DinJ family antitoxin n=1 Tax=uncultured Turicimonas sp. TaxID=1918607 RepID=UPI0028045578|nr:type II toxin-antitoxin system RelB/DinJ family antitoxin [uncultured Turicimonas sp.]